MNVFDKNLAITLLLALSFSSTACTVRKQDWGKSESGKKEFVDKGESQSETLFKPESFSESEDDEEATTEQNSILSAAATSGGAILSEATGLCVGIKNSSHPMSPGKGPWECLQAFAESELTEGLPRSDRSLQQSVQNLRNKKLVFTRGTGPITATLKLPELSEDGLDYAIATFRKEESVNTLLNGRLTFNIFDLNQAENPDAPASHVLTLVEHSDQSGVWKVSEIRRVNIESAKELLSLRDNLADPENGRVTLFSNPRYFGTLEALIVEKQGRALVQSIGGEAAPENGEVQSIQSVARKYAASVTQTQIIVPVATDVDANKPLISYQMNERVVIEGNIGGEMTEILIDNYFGSDEDDSTSIEVLSSSTEGMETKLVSQRVLETGYLMTTVSQSPEAAESKNQIIVSIEILEDI